MPSKWLFLLHHLLSEWRHPVSKIGALDKTCHFYPYPPQPVWCCPFLKCSLWKLLTMHKSKENSIMMSKCLCSLGSWGSRLQDGDCRTFIRECFKEKDTDRKKQKWAEGETELRCSPSRGFQQPHGRCGPGIALEKGTKLQRGLRPLQWSVIECGLPWEEMTFNEGAFLPLRQPPSRTDSWGLPAAALPAARRVSHSWDIWVPYPASAAVPASKISTRGFFHQYLYASLPSPPIILKQILDII